MNIQYYRSFIGIVEAGSFSEASRRCGVAQPALSNQVKSLEDRFKARLLKRGSGTHGLELTEAGRVLYETAKRICAAEDEALREIAGMREDGAEGLRIGFFETAGADVRLALEKRFALQYPETKLVWTVADLETLFELLRTGSVDGVVCEPCEADPTLFTCVLNRANAVVACYRSGAFFAGNRMEEIPLGELAKFPLCVPREKLAEYRAAFRAEGAMLTPRYLLPDQNACLAAAGAGQAVALVPELLIGKDMSVKRIAGNALGGSALALYTQNKEIGSYALRRITAVLENGKQQDAVREEREGDQQK